MWRAADTASLAPSVPSRARPAHALHTLHSEGVHAPWGGGRPTLHCTAPPGCPLHTGRAGRAGRRWGMAGALCCTGRWWLGGSRADPSSAAQCGARTYHRHLIVAAVRAAVRGHYLRVSPTTCKPVVNITDHHHCEELVNSV